MNIATEPENETLEAVTVAAEQEIAQSEDARRQAFLEANAAARRRLVAGLQREYRKLAEVRSEFGVGAQQLFENWRAEQEDNTDDDQTTVNEVAKSEKKSDA